MIEIFLIFEMNHSKFVIGHINYLFCMEIKFPLILHRKFSCELWKDRNLQSYYGILGKIGNFN